MQNAEGDEAAYAHSGMGSETAGVSCAKIVQSLTVMLPMVKHAGVCRTIIVVPWEMARIEPDKVRTALSKRLLLGPEWGADCNIRSGDDERRGKQRRRGDL